MDPFGDERNALYQENAKAAFGPTIQDYSGYSDPDLAVERQDASNFNDYLEATHNIAFEDLLSIQGNLVLRKRNLEYQLAILNGMKKQTTIGKVEEVADELGRVEYELKEVNSKIKERL